MIDELEILKTILENLSTVGIQGVCAYIAYKILIASIWLAGCIYTVKVAAGLILRLNEVGATKAENESFTLQSLREERDRYKRETEEVKHMYKLMKKKPNEYLAKPDVKPVRTTTRTIWLWNSRSYLQQWRLAG